MSTAANKCANSLCTTLANDDLAPHIPALVKCMANPDSVPAVIKSLSNTTFVAEVTAPALAVLVPLLLRALNTKTFIKVFASRPRQAVDPHSQTRARSAWPAGSAPLKMQGIETETGKRARRRRDWRALRARTSVVRLHRTTEASQA